MFVIFGWGSGSTKDLGPSLLIDCPNCHNKGYWHLYKTKRWFSLFFIPLFSYESNYQLLCETCSRGINLHGNEVEAALKLNEEAAKVIEGSLGEKQLLQSAEKSGLFNKAMAIKPKIGNVSKDAKWSKANDDLVEAILKSNTHPQIGIDKIKELLAEGLNINAKSESGRTVLSYANYHEANSAVKALLVSAGAKE